MTDSKQINVSFSFDAKEFYSQIIKRMQEEILKAAINKQAEKTLEDKLNKHKMNIDSADFYINAMKLMLNDLNLKAELEKYKTALKKNRKL